MARDPKPRISSFVLDGDEYVVWSVPKTPRATQRLTAAELGVYAGLVEGLTNAQIARLRGCATRTVANQVASIFRKLEVQSRAELRASHSAGKNRAGSR